MPTEFHRAGLTHRLRKPAWWRPLVEFVVLAVCIAAFTMAMAVPIGLAAGFYGLGDLFDETSSDPLAFLVQVLFIAAWLPAPFIAARVLGRKPGALSSIEGHFRWGVAGRAFVVVGVIYGAQVLLDALLFGTGDLSLSPREWMLLAAFVVVVPLQAAAEEYVFRASLPQILGQWISPGWICYGLPAAVFVALHLYNWIGLLDIAIFALCAALLTWHTRGVEAAVVLHAVSNTIVFSYGTLGLTDPGETEIPLPQTAVSALLTIGTTALLMWVLRDVGKHSQQKVVVPSPAKA